MCVLLDVRSGGQSRKVMFRCAMPHNLAEAKYSGTMDEMLGCEVGAYVWMQEKCPDVRIYHLYSFGFSDGSHVITPSNSVASPSSLALFADLHTQFTHIRYRPFWSRVSHSFWRCV